MILVDSSVWIDYFRGASTPQTEKLDSLLDSQPLAIGDLILAEVLQGFEDDRQFEEARNHLSVFSLVQIGGEDVALRAASNFRLLRRRGVTVRKTIDTLIATRCMMDDMALLHSDRDFEPFTAYLGLRSVI
ncbi:MAG: PIN domain nuclease [Brevundimonas sp.]|uniref:type II toxin-antitoxin system VapC family toxin n=1 Tax=Brevundimonas sp. TaxID=1871086 RepID=UPI0025BC5A8D|nr:PIN domain nuclease [Brevundimonas sp.]MBX3476020.1 PIN domain nuclease [Brevundimonas sp.]